MRLFLIRHGETALNASRTFQPADTPLNARGLRQAAALARRLAALGVARVVGSDLPRASATAEAIAAATGAPFETTPLLQERNFGDWRGRPHDSLGFDLGLDHGRDPLTAAAAPPGGESAAAFEQRVAQAWAHVLQRGHETPGTLAVVTHGLVLRVLFGPRGPLAAIQPAGLADDADQADLGAPRRFGNTSLSIVDTGPPLRVTRLDCTRHLDGMEPDDPAALSGG